MNRRRKKDGKREDTLIKSDKKDKLKCIYPNVEPGKIRKQKQRENKTKEVR